MHRKLRFQQLERVIGGEGEDKYGGSKKLHWGTGKNTMFYQFFLMLGDFPIC
jgi:hypothetical protein